MTGQLNRRGFTIIEVMLFLAITGLMMAGMFIGVSGSLDRQRYHDATTSMTDFVQGQYNLVNNVNTNRVSTLECTSGTISLGTGQPRGTSNCTIIGRYITSSDGRKWTSRPVYARADITTISNEDYTTEDEYIELLDLGMTDLYNGDDEQYTVAWDTYVYTDKTNPTTTNAFTLLLLKLPTNGLTRTYAVNTGNQSVGDVVAAGRLEAQPFLLCVATDGMVSTPAMGVKLLPLASNTSGVQPTTASEESC